MTQTGQPTPIFVEPGVGNAYGNGWRQLWRNFLELLLTGIIWIAVTVPVGIIVGLAFAIGWTGASWGITFLGSVDINTSMNWGAQAVNTVLNILYFTPLSYGLLFVFLTAARGEKVEFGNLFAGFKRNYTNILLVALIFFVIFSLPSILIQLLVSAVPVIGWIIYIAWIVVSIILYCKLAFVPFLMVDKEMQATEAIRTSWDWTNGYTGQIFLIFLLAIPIMIAGFIIVIVGSIPAAMWIATSFSSQYHAVKLRREPPQPTTPGGPFIMA